VKDRDEAVSRLRHTADCLASALERDDDERHVRKALAPLWPDFIADAPTATTKARAAARLRSGSSLNITTAGTLSTAAGRPLKSVRSFGHPHLSE
jgi:hypothetical protein